MIWSYFYFKGVFKMLEKLVFSYLIFINLIGFLMMWLDKRKAMKRKRRISEKSIWLLTLIGGSIGIYLAMYFYRHKTKHKQFVLGVPFIIILQLGFILYLVIKIL